VSTEDDPTRQRPTDAGGLSGATAASDVTAEIPAVDDASLSKKERKAREKAEKEAAKAREEAERAAEKEKARAEERATELQSDAAEKAEAERKAAEESAKETRAEGDADARRTRELAEAEAKRMREAAQAKIDTPTEVSGARLTSPGVGAQSAPRAQAAASLGASAAGTPRPTVDAPPVGPDEKPELVVGAAFAGAFLFAKLLKRITS
jgi:hypothetical protein